MKPSISVLFGYLLLANWCQAGSVRYEVIHLEIAYPVPQGLVFRSMSKGGIITGQTDTDIVYIKEGQLHSFPQPLPLGQGGYSGYGDSGIMYARNFPSPPSYDVDGFYSVDLAGNLTRISGEPLGHPNTFHGQNSSGVLVGNAAGVVPNAGWIYDPASGARIVTSLGGVLVRDLDAINNLGWMVGTGSGGGGRTFLWQEGQPAIALTTNLSSGAEDLNDLGMVVGYDGNKAFIWNGGQKLLTGEFLVEDPDRPGVFNDASSLPSAVSVNNRGEVIGGNGIRIVPGIDQVVPHYAWLWTQQNGLEYLDNLIDPALGIKILGAQTIAEDGSILGHGIVPGFEGSQRLLLRPVPEPNLLLGFYLLFLVARRKRSHG